MLSISAFNALLKIIEEPPEHLLFILATTELHKVPATILSRCQRFSFRRISQEDIASRLQYVAYQENIDLDDSAARVLARLADGGMRDGLSLLDQCASATTGELTAQRVYQCLGIAGIQDCGTLMRYIAGHDTRSVMALVDRIYAEGKDMGALLDELSCLTRDLMVLKTAPKEGISMLSGVASDEEVKNLSGRFSNAELVRMMNLLQQTKANFTRSASRRMEAELCIVNLCLPELSLDADALNSRINRLEEKLATGDFQMLPAKKEQTKNDPADDDDIPPMPDDSDAPPDPMEYAAPVTAPAGFWLEVATSIREELKPPAVGFFAPTQNAAVKGVLKGNELVLECSNSFTAEIINKADILQIVSRKASAKLGHPVSVSVLDLTAKPKNNAHMEQLLNFGRAHGDIIKIKE